MPPTGLPTPLHTREHLILNLVAFFSVMTLTLAASFRRAVVRKSRISLISFGCKARGAGSSGQRPTRQRHPTREHTSDGGNACPALLLRVRTRRHIPPRINLPHNFKLATAAVRDGR